MIEFSHVSKLFGAQKAVNDLNLNFQEGSFSVLIGTSGSGKSTTLKMINRLVEHDSGEIRFAGEEIRSLPVLELRRRMGYAIQSIGLFPHWSVAQNIATVPQLQKWSRANFFSGKADLSAVMFHQAVNHFQGGGFAGARCANQHRKTPFLKIEIEIVNGFLCAKQFADMAKFNHYVSPSTVR